MRVLNSMKQYDQSLSIADTSYPDSFAALYQELKGDALLGKGEINLARIAYDKAILSAGVQANRWLKLKRDDLGEIELDEYEKADQGQGDHQAGEVLTAVRHHRQ